MNTHEAFNLAHAFIRANGSGVLDSDYGRIVQAYNLLADSDDPDESETAAMLFSAYRYVIENHDEKGNYCGAVANENGWTA